MVLQMVRMEQLLLRSQRDKEPNQKRRKRSVKGKSVQIPSKSIKVVQIENWRNNERENSREVN
jgi:hypothetical protein